MATVTTTESPPSTLRLLIQSDQEDRTFGSVGFTGQLLCALAVVVEHAHSYPPIARRDCRNVGLWRYDSGGQMVGKVVAACSSGKAANLHCPISAGLQRRREFP